MPLAALRFLRLAIPRLVRVPYRQGRTPLPIRFGHPVCSGALRGNHRGSQVPVKPRLSVRTCSSDPGWIGFSDHYENPMLFPISQRRKLQRQTLFRGSIAGHSNWL